MAFLDLIKQHKPHEEDDNPWLISYSDIVTLLLCFFVVLISISNLDLVKIELMTQHFARKDRITLAQLTEIIQEFINSENLQNEISVKLTPQGVEISFKDKLLFELGKADLKPESLPILAKISSLFNYKEIADRKISVEGHTDSLPIRGGIYPSNWELSSARAANVVRFFISRGLDSRRFESIGYADTQPVKPETDPVRGQPENRRVVVVVTPESYLTKEARKEISVTSSAGTFKPEEIIRRELTTTLKRRDEKVALVIPDKTQNIKEVTKPVSKEEDNFARKRLMERYFSKGQEYFQQGNYEQAISCWEAVLELDPNHELSIKNIARAKKLLETHVKKHTVPESVLSEPSVEYVQKITSSQEEKVEELTKKELMSKYFIQGQKYFQQGKYKEAISCWQEVLKLDPDHELSKKNIQRARKRLLFAQSKR